jgi:hypothetical protein
MIKSNSDKIIDIGMKSDIAAIMDEFPTPMDEDYFHNSLDEPIPMDKSDIVLHQITLSPIPIGLRFRVDDDFISNYMDKYKVELLLDDGSRIALDNWSTDGRDKELIIQSLLPVIVKTDHIKAITINGREVQIIR